MYQPHIISHAHTGMSYPHNLGDIALRGMIYSTIYRVTVSGGPMKQEAPGGRLIACPYRNHRPSGR